MIGLVLQGGGARGSYHLGAIEALYERGYRFNTVVGTSIGAINGAFIASNEFSKLKNLWLSFNSKTLFGVDSKELISMEKNRVKLSTLKNTVDITLKLFSGKGIDITNFMDILHDNLNEDKLLKSKINFGLVTYRMKDKKPIEIFKEDMKKGKISEYLMASSFLPVFKKQKLIDDEYYLDGGVYDNCPIEMLDIDKYDRIFIIKTYKNDSVDKKLKKKNTILIVPNRNLGSQISFDKEITKLNFKIGYYDTIKALDNLDGYKYYIRHRSEEHYEKLFDEKIKKSVLFEKSIIKDIKEKKIIIKILENLATEYKLNPFKVYSLNEIIGILKIKMINNKNHKYYKFIKNIKLL